MHEEGDGDDPLPDLLTKGYDAWVVSGVGLDHSLLRGLVARLRIGLLLGCSDMPGKPLSSIFFLFHFSFLFSILFYNSVLIQI
jgi:hypothetical protein